MKLALALINAQLKNGEFHQGMIYMKNVFLTIRKVLIRQ